MSGGLTLTIDGRTIEVPAGGSVMDACDLAGIYVPRLCAYPGLEPLGDCGLCFVGIDGEARRACSVKAKSGMSVSTTDQQARGFRRSSMEAILGDHPHVCLTCPQRDGCSRVECVYGNPPEVRCCEQFDRCEIAKVAAYVGALDQAPSYQLRALPETTEQNITRRLDLCVGCGRCVAACDTLEEAGSALRLVETASLIQASTGASGAWEPKSYLGRNVAVPKAETLRESGCTFCGDCILVCPTGALTASGERGAIWLSKRRERSTLAPAVLPSDQRMRFDADTLAQVPSGEGVFHLLDRAGAVLQISGVPHLQAGLREALSSSLAADVAFFTFEESAMYTQRESEMLARYLQEHGTMPRGNDVAGELSDDGEEQA